ncbi:hypothetical protein CS022_22650 [Veronia nyctiphanis]|uniref:LRAT domain-containing protein n=1 Tax=Veronia nyctiphanis TaxID=1278244 RepID=A0A4V1LS70_9GAMM|nr:lecithin retinol acyltransferase family protein [Veronia nyctiphanis]RXJ70668.1 hypothetical protein CS022_22650 [Veronia nyctiphanis]
MKFSLSVGDILYRSKSIVQHVGVVVGPNQVIHNTPSNGVSITSYDEYAAGKEVKVKSENLSVEQQDALIEKALEIVNSAKSYNLVAFNCEQLATLITEGRPRSEQVAGAVVGAGAGYLVSKAMESNQTFMAVTVGAALGCLAVNAARTYSGKIRAQ